MGKKNDSQMDKYIFQADVKNVPCGRWVERGSELNYDPGERGVGRTMKGRNREEFNDMKDSSNDGQVARGGGQAKDGSNEGWIQRGMG